MRLKGKKCWLKMVRGGLFMSLIATAVLATSNSLVADDDVDRDRDAEVAVDPMGMKFVRGIVNMGTGWCELIPRQFIRSYQLDGPWLCFPYGLARGLFMTVVRTGAGVVETTFFYVPFDGSYGSIIDPAYVWQAEKKDNAENQGISYQGR